MGQSLGNLLQKLIPDRVPQRIIDVLEIIEIDKQKSAVIFMSARTNNFVLQTFQQMRPVRQVSKIIVVGHILHSFFGLFTRRDIVGNQ